MKSLPFLLLIIVPLASFSQTQKDCIQVMDKFVRYFNSEQLDSLNSLFQNLRGEEKHLMIAEMIWGILFHIIL